MWYEISKFFNKINYVDEKNKKALKKNQYKNQNILGAAVFGILPKFAQYIYKYYKLINILYYI